MSRKYDIFDRVVWFDFEGPEYLIGAQCHRQFIDTRFLYFKLYLN
jgi:hypothetical protein